MLALVVVVYNYQLSQLSLLAIWLPHLKHCAKMELCILGLQGEILEQL